MLHKLMAHIAHHGWAGTEAKVIVIEAPSDKNMLKFAMDKLATLHSVGCGMLPMWDRRQRKRTVLLRPFDVVSETPMDPNAAQLGPRKLMVVSKLAML